MKIFSMVLFALSATLTLSKFTPVANYDVALLAGTWHVQSMYDTLGNDWTLTYCFQVKFDIINSSAINLTTIYLDGLTDIVMNQTFTYYPNSSIPSILYEDVDHKEPPLVVVNTSSLPYWANNTSNTTILAINHTSSSGNNKYTVIGLSRWYDTEYDITPFLKSNSLPIKSTENFWFIDTACDTHFNWKPLPLFHEASLQGTWNLVGVYDPVGTNLVPWYTQGGIYDWNQAYCAHVSFGPGKVKFDHYMNMTTRSLYQGGFQRTWRIVPDPQLNSILYGFNINGNSLLYVQYADVAGNLILTAGSSTSFFLSNTANTLTPVGRGIFELALRTMGAKVDVSLIQAIDNSNC